MLGRLQRDFALAIVTSGSKSRVAADMHRLDIANFFETVVTGDDITEPKPSPEALDLALSHLSIGPHEAVYVGDAHADFEMSRSAGVPFIGVMSDFANLKDDHPEYDVHPIGTLADVIKNRYEPRT
jgi:pyrophosphatase PpaX